MGAGVLVTETSGMEGAGDERGGALDPGGEKIIPPDRESDKCIC